MNLLFAEGFVSALVMSVLLIRWLRGHASWFGLVDVPGEARRLHTRPVATVGGVGLFLAMTLASLLIVATSSVEVRNPAAFAAIVPIGLGALAMHLTGLWDDRSGLSAHVKAALQVLVSLAVFLAGVRIEAVEVPFLGRLEFAYWVSMAITVFWFVGVTNAFNLVDGTDGLAGGAALIATSAMFLVALALGHELVALFLAVMAGATLGFLCYNFPPASVFMGDAGSLLLGFLLAGLGIVSSAKAATTVAIAVPIVAFGLPVLDTTLAVVRRTLRGDRIWVPDRGHIHHRLLDLGFSPREVAITLYGVCGIFALLSFLGLSDDGRLLAPIFLVLGLAVLVGVQSLRIPELLEIRKLIGRGIGRRRAMARSAEIRDHARRVSEAKSLEQVFRGLGTAFEKADLDEVEVWLSRGYAGELNVSGEASGLTVDGDGYLWQWKNWERIRPESDSLWEVNLPLVAPGGEAVGRLTIRRLLAEELPLELRVIVEEMVPAVAQGLASNTESAGRLIADGTHGLSGATVLGGLRAVLGGRAAASSREDFRTRPTQTGDG